WAHPGHTVEVTQVPQSDGSHNRGEDEQSQKQDALHLLCATGRGELVRSAVSQGTKLLVAGAMIVPFGLLRVEEAARNYPPALDSKPDGAQPDGSTSEAPTPNAERARPASWSA